MLGRFLFVGMCASVGSLALASPPDFSEREAATPERLRLTCTGTMLTADQPPPGSRVLADAVVDFAAKRVSGFGIGSPPIVLLTATDISFGTAPGDDPRGSIIEGSINRQTGGTRVVVRSGKRPSDLVIEMQLDCSFEPPVS